MTQSSIELSEQVLRLERRLRGVYRLLVVLCLGSALALNRWVHAYVNPQPGFFFGVNGKPAPRDVLRDQPHGRIAFANTDLAGASDHRNSIREADRAVKQLIGA